MPAVRSKNARVELEMKNNEVRHMASRTVDERSVKRIRDYIAELQQKLREIDQ
jgi:hypothetical protein